MLRLWSVAVLGLGLQSPSAPLNFPNPTVDTAATGGLALGAAQAQSLQKALQKKDYSSAEAVLLDALHGSPGLPETDARLLFLGGVYFLDHDALQAAVAWNKAAALSPLPAGIRFSLAMSYVQMRHPAWAERLLQELAGGDPRNALYPFWLGRLAYDGHRYEAAVADFRRSIAADPKFAKAHDNLGLALFYLNRNDEAIAEFRQAIALEAGQPDASPWPDLNLGLAYAFVGKEAEAVAAFRQALALDPHFAEAHYRLGNALAGMDGKLNEAIAEEQAAARDDPAYAEPHEVLARLYRRHGEAELSQREVELYQKLHGKKQSQEP